MNLLRSSKVLHREDPFPCRCRVADVVCIIGCAKLPQLLCKLLAIVYCDSASSATLGENLPQSYHRSFVKFRAHGRRSSMVETAAIIAVAVNKHLLLLHPHQLIQGEAAHVRKAVPFDLAIIVATNGKPFHLAQLWIRHGSQDRHIWASPVALWGQGRGSRRVLGGGDRVHSDCGRPLRDNVPRGQTCRDVRVGILALSQSWWWCHRHHLRMATKVQQIRGR